MTVCDVVYFTGRHLLWPIHQSWRSRGSYSVLWLSIWVWGPEQPEVLLQRQPALHMSAAGVIYLYQPAKRKVQASRWHEGEGIQSDDYQPNPSRFWAVPVWRPQRHRPGCFHCCWPASQRWEKMVLPHPTGVNHYSTHVKYLKEKSSHARHF